MKSNIKIRIFILNLMLILFFTQSYSQCGKKIMCKDDDMGDEFDYTSQSSFATLSPGDTATVKLVAYSGKVYRIMICGDTKLGEIQYKIVTPVRKDKRSYTVKKNESSEGVLKPDVNGFVFDNFGNKYKLEPNGDLSESKVENKKTVTTIYTRNEEGNFSSSDGAVIPYNTLKLTINNFVSYDTTWTSTRITDEELIYDSRNNKTGKKYWEGTIKKTQRIFIKVEVPSGDKNYTGCLGMYVGNKMMTNKKFTK